MSTLCWTSFRRRERYTGTVLFGSLTLFLVVIFNYQTQEVHQEIPFQEIRKFAFAKNHKCGSSTVENVIFRYAYKNQLNVVIPAVGNYLSNEELFDHTSLNKAWWRNVPFDIFSLHSRWNRKEVMILLKEEVPTFAIVRNPVDVFISLFQFQPELRRHYGVNDIYDMVRLIKSKPSSPLLNKRFYKNIGRNQMAWDMGLSPDIFDNQTAMQKEIERLDTEFNLVMISDRMDESLVLLKELLHWPMENVVHLDLNRKKPENSPKLSANERSILASWLSADVQIFEYFSRRFNERVEEINRKYNPSWFIFRETFVEKETRLLKKANKQLYDQCVIKEVNNEELTEDFRRSNNSTLGYVINMKEKECGLYAMTELAYLKRFKEILMKHAHNQRHL